MSHENQPCPFCGFDDVEIDEIDRGVFAVTCPECNATGPWDYNTPYGALAAWNLRVPRVTSEPEAAP